MGVLILTHRRLLVDQFTRDLTTEGYGDRLALQSSRARSRCGTTPHHSDVRVVRAARRLALAHCVPAGHLRRGAHGARRKTGSAIRRFTQPIYIGMTATEQLIAKQVSDVFPASVDDLPLGDAARRGLIAPLRSLRVRPAAISLVPIVGGDYDQEILAKVLDQDIFNQAAASLYRDRFDATPGIVYAAGVDHAYNLARVRAAGLKAEAVSGHAAGAACRDPGRLRARRHQRPHQRPAPRRRMELAARHRACTWPRPRAGGVYQQRIGRIMRLAPRKEAGIVIDFVDDAATHTDRTITIHSLLDSDFYRPGARVTPAPRRRIRGARNASSRPHPGSSPSRPTHAAA